MVRSRLLSKRVVVTLVLLGAAMLFIAGGRPWVTGTADDAVLGRHAVVAEGGEIARGVMGGAAVAAAAVLASAAVGRLGRLVAGAAVALAGVGALVGCLLVLADPEGVAGRLAAARTGRTGTLQVDAAVTPWVPVAILASCAVLLGGLAVLLAARQWSGLSSRYDAPGPVDGGPAARAQDDGAVRPSGREHQRAGRGLSERRPGQRSDDVWDALSRGEDPT